MELDLTYLVTAGKLIGAGTATVALIGAGVGAGVIFGALILGVAKNPEKRNDLFSLAILSFALTEAIGLFACAPFNYILGKIVLFSMNSN